MAEQETKPVAAWEREANTFVTDETVDLEEKITWDEFVKLYMVDRSRSLGVNFEFREKWLKDNGYEVNRKNMIDTSLSGKITLPDDEQ